MATWYYYNESGEKIEVTGGQLKGLAKAGMITPETMVETEDGKTVPARKIKGLTFIETPQSETPPSAEPVPTQDVSLAPTPSESVNSDAFNAAMNQLTPSLMPPVPSIAQGASGDYIAQSPSGRLVVMSEPTVYLPKNASSKWRNFFRITFDGKDIRPTRGVFNVDGHKVTVQFFSTDNNIVDFFIKDSNGTIVTTFNQPGSATCSITVGKDRVQKVVNVVELPVEVSVLPSNPLGQPQKFVSGSTIHEVISLLGFPDFIESVDMSHPDTIGKDCVIYQPEVKDGLVYAQHFHYDSRYPGLVLFFVKGKTEIISLKARTPAVDPTDNLPTHVLQHHFKAKPPKPASCLPFVIALVVLGLIGGFAVLYSLSPIVAILSVPAIIGVVLFAWIYRQKLLPLLPASIKIKLEEKLGQKLDK